MEIVKFGGSSMATPTTIRLCRDIVINNKQAQVIVVSAPGKYGKYTTKITDDLIQYTQKATNLDAIIQRFNDIAQELLSNKQYEIFANSLKETKTAMFKRSDDYNFIVSRGEYLAARLFAIYIGYNFIDAEEILVIKNDATIDLDETRKQIKSHNLKQKIPFVMGGFYGQRDGKTALFTRGGSDYTGAILAVLMNATIYKNYTDTYGIQTSNPKLVNNTKTITCLDFKALDVLTHNGAGVIHENVAQLLETHHVPLRVDNTFDPHKFFTEVHSQRCRNCQHHFFCVINQNNNIHIIQQRHDTAITIQTFKSTPQTINEDLQKLHLEMLKRL